MTIPRLELTAVLIGSRLLANVRDSLQLSNCSEYCWTDSEVALCWVKRELSLNTFVDNRVKEIRRNTNICDWYHVPGELNWADLASRGCNAKKLFECRWWEGPSWLRLTPADWPHSELVVNEKEVLAETRKTVCNVNVNIDENFICSLQKYFSIYSKTVRMTAWVLRFAHNIKNIDNKRKGELTSKEFEKAEEFIIRLIQLVNKEYLDKCSGNLITFKDSDELLRIKTKLLLSDFPETIKSPYLLPARDPVVLMLVRQRHLHLQRAGANQLIADIRSRFWIIGIRRLVRQVIMSCVVCKRHKAKPTIAPIAPLPLERVTCSAPFQTTGVDLAGPLFLRNGKKCWIVLYTCAVYRAVHLEVAISLSTEDFIMTLRRFIARRGRINMLNSDQGTNFHGTKNLLAKLDWNEIQKYSTVKRITWKMNAPAAPWWGGYWERLIRIMKDLLRRVLGNAAVSHEELHTIICDCEATMNGRPLTFINDDKAEYLEPLTPAYFIQPISSSNVVDLDEIDRTNLNKRLKYLQELRDQFRQRFKADYLVFLVQKGNEKKDIIKKGDVVLVQTDEKRIKWPLAIVEDLFPGIDGVVRTARIKTASGVKVRAIQRLYKLEISDEDRTLLNSVEPAGEKESVHTAESTRRRVSAHPTKTTRLGRNIRFPSRFDVYV